MQQLANINTSIARNTDFQHLLKKYFYTVANCMQHCNILSLHCNCTERKVTKPRFLQYATLQHSYILLSAFIVKILLAIQYSSRSYAALQQIALCCNCIQKGKDYKKYVVKLLTFLQYASNATLQHTFIMLQLYRIQKLYSTYVAIKY